MSTEMLNAGYEKFQNDLFNAGVQEKSPYLANLQDFDMVDSDTSVSDRHFIGKVFNNVNKALEALNFWDDTKPINSLGLEATDLKSIYSKASASAGSILGGAYPVLKKLVADCDTPVSQREVTIQNLALTLKSYLGNHASTEFFNPTKKGENFKSLESLYPQAALGDAVFDNSRPSMEMFGSTMDQMTPDIRVSMTVSLVKPHKGIWSRVMHKRNTNTNAITYQVFQDEFYDLHKSQDLSSAIRNGMEHRFNIKDLMRNPDPVQMVLKKVEVLKARDTDPTNPFLFADGYLLFGKECNLWDLATVPESIALSRHNWTDLLSEKINLEEVQFSITRAAYTAADGTAYPELTETFKESVLGRPDSAFQQRLTTRSSAELDVSCKARIPLHAELQTADKQPSEIFAGLMLNQSYLQLLLDLTGSVHKQEGNVIVNCNSRVKICTQPDMLVPDSIKELASNLEMTFDCYSIDARYSEENLRKVNMAVRSLTYPVTYDLPQPKGIVAEYSLFQNMQEHILDVAQNLLMLGIDHRNIQMTTKTLADVHDNTLREILDPNFRVNSGGDSASRFYVSSNKINPIVIMGDLDLTNIQTVRFSDAFGDIRQYVTSFMTKIISNLHAYSLYTQQINPGEVPTYKVITSTPIVENILAIPHIHAHFDKEQEALYQTRNLDDKVEYTRVLPSGVRLECVTTAFAYMQDKIILMPYRPNDPHSSLNFGHNWDGGNYAVNFTPNDGGEAHRRMYMAAREWMLINNPCAIVLTVKGMREKLPTLGTEVNDYLNKLLQV